ncbi:MAG: helix-turn-helix transcriptional regulator [Lachnospiraceae bacterium]|jgi:transcriptional regulator with XRE-family HTH domain|nr:helix-turn-helix transcriptional regulator [uncultured Acetatifactor sp.]MCI9220913.1 helix-turn-helix transcriptional regulator [Lachnospiraceae bacterium]
MELEKTAMRIASLRRERGYTGEALAERLQVSPQAVSKWENAKCLPETAILPALAEALDCSIDSLLCPRELFILEAVYTDGETQIPVTRALDNLVRDNVLDIYVNPAFIGASMESDRLKVLTVKFQTPAGVGFSYALQNENLTLDKKSAGFEGDRPFWIIGAYYGNEKEYFCAMQKLEHYEYFKWDRIQVNHETFPSSTASDDTEYLTLIYLNAEGIHVLSCPENDTVYYGGHGTRLLLQDRSKCILEHVKPLVWEKGAEGLECPWAGALQAALSYMGEPCTYEQIMGMSGACYRICFTDVWDYSCTDALVAFDYATPLYSAIGYGFCMVERLEKRERKAERRAIMEDIRRGKPVLAINLRVAPEWGVITGYTDNGNRFLCRTYFDKEVFDALEQADGQTQEDRRMVFEENSGYLFSEFWPFLITHFGEKGEKKSPMDILKTSLATLIDSFQAQECRGYHQGKDAYRAWMIGLSREEDFRLENDKENVQRRLSVNDAMLGNLIDARRAAANWLRENLSLIPDTGREQLAKIAQNCQTIADEAAALRRKACRFSDCEVTYNTTDTAGMSTLTLRREQTALLEQALALEEENCQLSRLVLKAWG